MANMTGKSPRVSGILPSEKQEFCTLYLGGKTHGEIAEWFGVTPAVVRHHVTKYKLPRRKFPAEPAGRNLTLYLTPGVFAHLASLRRSTGLSSSKIVSRLVTREIERLQDTEAKS